MKDIDSIDNFTVSESSFVIQIVKEKIVGMQQH